MTRQVPSVPPDRLFGQSGARSSAIRSTCSIVMTSLPPTTPMQRAQIAPTVPASMTPQAVSRSRGVGWNSQVSRISSNSTPRASATIVTAAPHPHLRTPGLLTPPW